MQQLPQLVHFLLLNFSISNFQEPAGEAFGSATAFRV